MLPRALDEHRKIQRHSQKRFQRPNNNSVEVKCQKARPVGKVPCEIVIVRSLEPLLAVPLDLPVFIKGTWKHPCAHRSGVFSYQLTPETDAIWNEFVNPAQTRLGAPFTHPRIGKHVGIWNDEQWFGVYVGKNAWRGWHEVLAPGVLLGFKTDMHMSTQPLERETHVVYFDGLPRPHDVVAPWNYLTAPEHLRGEIPAEASLPVTGKWRIL